MVLQDQPATIPLGKGEVVSSIFTGSTIYNNDLVDGSQHSGTGTGAV
jgi:hypothetical protein